MKINLEFPYTQDWTSASIVINPEGRRTVILYSKIHKKQSSTSYSRYLMAVKIGRYLTSDEEVDHIDTDHTNDDLSNLQILSVEEHKEKTKKEQSGRTFVEKICTECGKKFSREIRQVKITTKFCSRECLYLNLKKSKSKLKTTSIQIKKKVKKPNKYNFSVVDIQRDINSGLSDIKIAELYGVDRNVILRFRKENNIISNKKQVADLLVENKEKIIELYNNGMSDRKIATIIGVSRNSIKRFIDKNT